MTTPTAGYGIVEDQVTATPLLADRRWMRDAGGCFPAAKAAVDAHVIRDDGPEHVAALTLRAPVVDRVNGLELVVGQLATSAPSPTTWGKRVTI